MIQRSTSYIFFKRPSYIWIIGTIELSLEDSGIDEADLTHTYTPSSNSENVQERAKKHTCTHREEETSRNS